MAKDSFMSCYYSFEDWIAKGHKESDVIEYLGEDIKEDLKDDPKVVSGTLLMFNYLAYVLIDFKSMHTFISKKFTEELPIKTEKLKLELCVSTPVGSTMCTKNGLRSCKLEITSNTFFVDLIVLDMYEFDVIFRRDWMYTCGVQIHCKTKQIFFVLEGERIVFKEIRFKLLPCIIFAMQAIRSKKKLSSLFGYYYRH